MRGCLLRLVLHQDGTDSIALKFDVIEDVVVPLALVVELGDGFEAAWISPYGHDHRARHSHGWGEGDANPPRPALVHGRTKRKRALEFPRSWLHQRYGRTRSSVLRSRSWSALQGEEEWIEAQSVIAARRYPRDRSDHTFYRANHQWSGRVYRWGGFASGANAFISVDGEKHVLAKIALPQYVELRVRRRRYDVSDGT